MATTSFAPHMSFQRSNSLPTIQKPRQIRPKLSLDTTSSQTKSDSLPFSAPVTGLTPTTQNTFNNTFSSCSSDLIQPRTGDNSAPTSVTTVRHDSGIAFPFSASIIIPKSHPTELISAPSSTASEFCPYALSPGIRSILVNGPLAKRPFSSRTSSLTGGSSDTTPTSQYQTNKRVCFKQPLQEDIRTEQYVLAHSDLPSRSPSPTGSKIFGRRLRSERREREGDALRLSVEEDSTAPDHDTVEGGAGISQIGGGVVVGSGAQEPAVLATPKMGRRWRDREKMWSRASAFLPHQEEDSIPRIASPSRTQSPSPVSPTTVPEAERLPPPRLYSPPPPSSKDDQTPSPEERETPRDGLASTPDRQQLSTALSNFRTSSPPEDVDAADTLRLPACLEEFKGAVSSPSSSEEDLDMSMSETIAAAMAFS